MQATLVRSAYSVNIKERLDCSTAIFDARGEVVAMPGDTTHPIHLSSLDDAVKSIAGRYADHRPGDMFVANDPYSGGGSHLPDISVVAPVHTASGDLVGYVANVAHHSDVGNASPTGRAIHLASIVQEGLRLPPVRLVHEGAVDQHVLAIVAMNSRTPNERTGDLRAQIAANLVGARRLLELVAEYGPGAMGMAMADVLAYSDRRVRTVIAALPDGDFEAVDWVDGDGLLAEPLMVRVVARKRDDEITFDFAGSAAQVPNAINCPLQATKAAVWTVVKSMLDPTMPPNAGTTRALHITAPAASIVNCAPPAATAERMTVVYVVGDVVAAALAQLIPSESASSYGAQIHYGTGGVDPRTGRYFIEYQAFAGGNGATAFSDGVDTAGQWTSGAPNGSVEADEIAYPQVVHRYELRQDSGGAGKFRGGLGIRRMISVYGDGAHPLSTIANRTTVPPPGLFNGEPGAPAGFVLHRQGADPAPLASMSSDFELAPGDQLEILSAGGGGWGPWEERDPQAVERDNDEGRVSVDLGDAWRAAIGGRAAGDAEGQPRAPSNRR
jgi:N-methylhydantoinase B